MTGTTPIADDMVVTMHYTLRLSDGQVVDSSAGNEPLAYLHGANNIVPGLEEALTGKGAGESFNVKVEPDKGYGPRHDEAVQDVPRAAFPADAELAEGIQFQAMDEEQRPIMGRIDKLTADKVTVDFNHPLAGEVLEFQIEVVDVRPATSDEKEHGHVHGPGGHEH